MLTGLLDTLATKSLLKPASGSVDNSKQGVACVVLRGLLADSVRVYNPLDIGQDWFLPFAAYSRWPVQELHYCFLHAGGSMVP